VATPGFFMYYFYHMKNYISIGKFVATHGVNGTLVLKHDLGKKTSFKELKAFFLEDLPGSFLPYFPLDIKARSEEEVLIEFEGITSKEKAARYVQKQVWLEESDFSKYAAANAPISLLGFMVYDGDEALGVVLEVIEQPHQVLCRIQYKEHDDVLIPINEASLVKIDNKTKRLLLDLPEGLIETQI
jgi:16S rRNA processing protein RimM